MPDELPEGWQAFTAALPPKLFAKLQARAEAEGADVLTEAAYLLAYGLDNAPRPSEANLEPMTDPERTEALQVRMRVGALVVGAAQKEKT